jgi:hypothetical protein
MAIIPCPACGKSFSPWRGKQFCAERCRKRAENRRLRGDDSPTLADSQKVEKNAQQNQDVEDRLRGDEGPASKLREAKWIFSNEITGKLDYHGTSLGWVMYAERPARWLGRVRDNRGQWSFKAANRTRAEKAVEAWLRHEPIEIIEPERMWAGDCLGII